LFSAGLSGEITEWDLATLEARESLSSGGGPVWALCGGGGRVFAACDDGSVRVFSLDGGSGGGLVHERRLNVGQLRVLSVAAFGDDSIFAGGSDSRITKWSLSSATCEGQMRLDRSKDNAHTLIWALANLGDSDIASGDSLGLVQVWDPITCTVRHRFAKHQADVLCLAASLDGRVLLSGGVDTKISAFVRQSGGEERWDFYNSELCHSYDVRAIAHTSSDARGPDRPYVSGGLAGKLFVHLLKPDGTSKATGAVGKKKRRAEEEEAPGSRRRSPLECSAFSPVLQTASVAQSSRLSLCQRNEKLELWYLRKPKLDTPSKPQGLAMPEAQLLFRLALDGEKEGEHVTASAISPDGGIVAASDLAGTRLFRLSLEELEVRREKGMPQEVRKTMARTLLFCGSAGLLAVAEWGGACQVLMVDVARLKVLARFAEHKAPVSLLASAQEWLASADASGAVHVFNLDTLQHHARVPVGGAGGAFATAMTFDARGSRLIVALSTHKLVIFDVESQTLAEGLPAHLEIPRQAFEPHSRICGLAAPPRAASKVLLWGHSSMAQLEIRPWAAAAEEVGRKPGTCRWLKYTRKNHLLALCALDEGQWGRPLLSDDGAAAGQEKAPAAGPAKRRRTAVQAMTLAMEVTPGAVERSLQQPFERKKFRGA